MMQSWGYPGVALAVFLECIYPPIPSEVILPFAGFLVAQGFLTFTGSLLAATLGSVLSALVYYCIGWFIPRKKILEFVKNHKRWLRVSEAHVELAFSWFKEKGGLAVFIGRVIPTVREFISIPAGVSRMSVLTYIAYTAAGSAIWNGALLGTGVILGSQWATVQTWFARYQNLVLLAIAVVIISLVALRKYHPLLKRPVREVLANCDLHATFLEKVVSQFKKPGFVSMILLVALSLAFAHVADDVREGEFWSLDMFAAQKIFHLQSPLITGLTELASLLVSPLTLLAIVASIGLSRNRSRFEKISLLVIATSGSLFSNTVLKLIFQRPRPTLTGSPLDTGFSFPSSHAAACTAFYAALVYLVMSSHRSKPERFAFPVLGTLAIVVIDLSRVHLGVHYPSDVIGGTIIGMIWTILAIESIRLAKAHVRSS